MEFVASTTFGTCRSSAPHVDNDFDYQMNVYHKHFLTWGFEKYLLRPAQTVSRMKLYESLIYSTKIYFSILNKGYQELESF